MYYDIEALLPPMKERALPPPDDSDESYMIKVNHHIPCGWSVEANSLMNKSLIQRRVIEGEIALRSFESTS